MFGLSGFKLGWLLGGLVWLGILVMAAVGLVRDRDRLQGVEDRALACEAAVRSSESTVLNCPQAISDAATRGARYLECDAGLKAGDLYVVRATCSQAVKRRDAEATALAASVDELTAQLTAARADTTAAVTRAIARAATTARKDANAKTAIARVVPGADGRITCDDRCLRDLAGN